MTKAKKTATSKKPIEQYEHKDKERLNNPPVGLVDAHTDSGGFKKKIYHNAEATTAIITAINDVPNFVGQVGSILIIKGTDTNGIVHLKTIELTTEQMIYVKKNASLLNNPLTLLSNLESQTDNT